MRFHTYLITVSTLQLDRLLILSTEIRVLVVLCSSFLKRCISEFRVSVVTEEEGKMYKNCDAGVTVFVIKLFLFHVVLVSGS